MALKSRNLSQLLSRTTHRIPAQVWDAAFGTVSLETMVIKKARSNELAGVTEENFIDAVSTNIGGPQAGHKFTVGPG
jgi:hypothetical protein